MRLFVGKMIGGSDGKFWGQVHDFVSDDAGKVQQRGRLIAVVSMEAEVETDQVEMVKTGREILSRLHELYFGKDDGSVMAAIKSAVEALRVEFEQVSVAALVVVGEYGYVCATGMAGVWVRTKSKQGFLTRVEETNKVRIFSGKMKDGTVFVLGDVRFWQNIPEEEAATLTATAERDMDEAVEVMTEKCGGGVAGGVAVAVRVSETVVSEEMVDAVESEQEEVVIRAEDGGRENKRGIRAGGVLGKLLGVGGRIYLQRGDKDEQRRKMRYFGLGLVAVLLVLAGIGQIKGGSDNVTVSQRNAVIEKMTTDFRDASAMAELNPVKSRELLTQIKNELERFKGDKKPDPRIGGILAQWDEVWARAMGIVRAEQSELIDLGLVREGMLAGGMAWSDDKLFVLDVDGFRVVEVDVDQGSGKVAAGGANLGGAKLIAGYPGKQVVVSEKGIIEVGVAAPKIAASETISAAMGIEMYGGNIYLLDAMGGEIWRFAAKADGYAEASRWLAEGENRDGIKTGSDLAIDGSIWVVETGKIEKFTRGVKDVFELGDLDKEWGGGVKIFTSEEIEKLYVLDPSNSRVVVLSKQGEYLKQYRNDAWGGAKDLVVDEKRGKIFLSIDGKVWAVNL